MKKKYLKVLGLGLVLSLLIAGCGKKNDTAEEVPDSTEEITVDTEATEDEETETSVADDLVQMSDVARPDISKLNLSDYVEVGDYTNLDLTVEKEEVSDSDIDAYIQNMLTSIATYTEVTDRASKEGDRLTISYEGTIDGETFDGGSAEDESFVLGNNFYLDEFEEALYDKNLGDIVDVELTFPEDYEEAVAGKTAKFKIVVNKIEESNTPELNEETIKTLSTTATTLDELRAEVKESLSYSIESSYKDEAYSTVVEQLAKITTVKSIPDDMFAYYKNVLYSYYSEYATIYGVSMADFLEQYCELTEDEFDAQCEEYATEASTQALALYYIGEKEDIELTDEEYATELENLAVEYGYDSVDALQEEIDGYNGEYEMRENIYFDKVCARLLEINQK